MFASILATGVEDELGGVVEEDAGAAVGQNVSQSVLRRVISPLLDPDLRSFHNLSSSRLYPPGLRHDLPFPLVPAAAAATTVGVTRAVRGDFTLGSLAGPNAGSLLRAVSGDGGGSCTGAVNSNFCCSPVAATEGTNCCR